MTAPGLDEDRTAAPRELGPARFQHQAEESGTGSRWSAVGSALLLLGLVAGVPALLLWAGGVPPVPTSLPTREQLTATIGAEHVLGVLLWIAWLAWLQFTVCVLVELRSAVRGVGLPARVPLSGPTQRMARALVVSVLLATTAAAPATALTYDAATGSAAGSGPAVVQVDQADTATATGAPATADVATQEAAPPGEATYRLGDLVLEPDEGAELAGKKVYVVRPPEGRYHDNLWDIAERELGDGRRYQEIFDLNKGRAQPDGQHLSLARLIQPNWLLVMPEDAAGAERVTAELAAPSTEGTGAQVDPVDTPVDAEVDTLADASGGAEGTAAAAGGPAILQDALGGSSLGDRSGLLGAGLLAAVLLGAVAAVRRRRPTPEPSDEAVEAEIALRIGADPERVSLLETALRGLAGAHEATRSPLPGVYAVRVEDRRVELLLSPPAVDAPEPWVVADGGRRWVRHADAQDPVVRHGGGSPYPGLVSVGRDADGADVLVDLEAAQGPVCVTGPHAREVVTAMAAELVTNSWSGRISVHGRDLPGELAVLGDRYSESRDPAEVLASWDARGASADVLRGRVVTGGAVSGEYLVLGAEPTEPLAGAVVRSAPGVRAPRGVLCVGDLPGARWRLEIDEEGTLRLSDLGLSVAANRLRPDQVRAVAELVEARPAITSSSSDDDRPDPEGGTRVEVPAPTRRVLASDLADAALVVRVLGVPRVEGTGELPAERTALTTELVVHLALHPDGVHPSVLAGDLWPHGVTAEVRDATIERARRWLGSSRSGEPRLSLGPDGRLRLSDDVLLDWDAGLTHLERSRSAPDAEAEAEELRAALGLAEGAVLSGRPGRRYAWLVRARLERLSRELLVDAAHRLAVLRSGVPDPDGAARAARAGLTADPTAEVLWRDLVRAAAHRGPDQVREVAAEAESVLHRAGRDGISAVTAALVAELASPERGSGVG